MGMAYKKISQRQARHLEKKLGTLMEMERRRSLAWLDDYPGGVHLGSLSEAQVGWLAHVVHTSRRLGHPVVVTRNSKGELMFFGVK